MTTSRFVNGDLGYLLGQANHAIYKGFDAQVRAAGLSFIEWRVLDALHDGRPLTVSRLARAVLSKQPTVTKLVQRMAEQGWVDLQADPADQRCTMVSVSRSGQQLVEPLVDAARAHEAGVLQTLSAAERETLKTLLNKLVSAAEPSRPVGISSPA